MTQNTQASAAHQPDVSVLIAAYNAAEFVVSAVQSVLSQQVENIEVIVVNDGSSDNTVALINQLNDKRLTVYSQANSGVSAARNFALAKARGKYSYFFDADDLLAPDALVRCLSKIDKQPDIVAVYGESITFATESDLQGKHFPPPEVQTKRPSGDITAQLLEGNCIACGGIMIRTDVLLSTNGFPAHIKLGEDWALWVELATKGRIEYLPRPPLLYYRQHDNSAARTLAKRELELTGAIDYIYQIDAITRRFTAEELQSKKNLARANAYSYSAQEFLKIQQWQSARKLYVKSLSLRPLHLRTLLLWLCAAIRLLPGFIRRRLK